MGLWITGVYIYIYNHRYINLSISALVTLGFTVLGFCSNITCLILFYYFFLRILFQAFSLGNLLMEKVWTMVLQSSGQLRVLSKVVGLCFYPIYERDMREEQW